MLARDDSPVALLRKHEGDASETQGGASETQGVAVGLVCRGLSGRELECRATTHSSYLPFFALRGRAVWPGPRLRRASEQEEMGICGLLDLGGWGLGQIPIYTAVRMLENTSRSLILSHSSRSETGHSMRNVRSVSRMEINRSERMCAFSGDSKSA
jgi:hypothetical protein